MADPYRICTFCMPFLSAADNDASRRNHTDIAGRGCEIADISPGRKKYLPYYLQGMRSPDLLLIPEKLKSLGNITDVVDESWPAYDLEELYKRYSGTLIGDYIGYFLAKGRMDTVEKKALYYGLQACWKPESRR